MGSGTRRVSRDTETAVTDEKVVRWLDLYTRAKCSNCNLEYSEIDTVRKRFLPQSRAETTIEYQRIHFQERNFPTLSPHIKAWRASAPDSFPYYIQWSSDLRTNTIQHLIISRHIKEQSIPSPRVKFSNRIPTHGENWRRQDPKVLGQCLQACSFWVAKFPATNNNQATHLRIQLRIISSNGEYMYLFKRQRKSSSRETFQHSHPIPGPKSARSK